MFTVLLYGGHVHTGVVGTDFRTDGSRLRGRKKNVKKKKTH